MATPKVLALMAAGAVALSVGSANAAPPAPVAGYAGQYPSAVAGCPMIVWRLAQQPDGKVSGMVWYGDMMGASSAAGTWGGGNFNITLTSVMGNGPVGTVTGTRAPDGKLQAHLVGTGCANMNFTSNPARNLNGWGTGG